MKRCSRCGLIKPRSEFHRYSRGDGCQPWCKTCRKSYDRDYCLRNKKRWAENKAAWNDKRKQWLRDLKIGRSCADCGGVFPPEAMQWDHLPGTVKLGEISNQLRNWKPKLIYEELAKCELVCANCHAVRTAMRLRNSSGVWRSW